MSLDVQIASLLASVVMGVSVGASLDTYERILGKRKSFNWIKIVNDVLFWIVQALLYFGVLLYMNHGEVRLYLLIAVFLGYSVYRALFETSYKKLLNTFLHISYHVSYFLVRITYIFLVNPTKELLKLLFRLGMILVMICWKVISSLIFWIFRPILLLITYVDKKIGQPFMKQREMFMKFLKGLYQRIKMDRKHKK
ncbi:spore cortex biosynthesis protein YabQ [Salipaludibacillus daqingensis]|uniref:spore cortex biosynthesis protein YabQ n=1 Tax=Salipaludibacillus daqingensis TaxID=3041001 RepID=UPI002473D2CE|nr:spore cortex biosynthesis protein YabQ [Salipaludibacillus daqingensis]